MTTNETNRIPLEQLAAEGSPSARIELAVLNIERELAAIRAELAKYAKVSVRKIDASFQRIANMANEQAPGGRAWDPRQSNGFYGRTK